MDFQNLFRAIQKAGHGLADAWLIKTLFAFIVATLTSVHGTAMIVVLVFIDLLTRWIALCYKHLQDCSRDSDLYSCIADIPMAMNVDKLLFASGETPFILKVVWTYLAATEAMSVLENLRDAGIEQAGSLLIFLRDRTTILLDRFKRK